MNKVLLILIILNLSVNVSTAEDKLSPDKQAALDAWIGKIEKKQMNTKSERRKFLEKNLSWIESMAKIFRDVTKYTTEAENGDIGAIKKLKSLEKKIFDGFNSQPFAPEDDEEMGNLASDTGSAFSDGHIGVKKVIEVFEEGDSIRREIATQRAAHYMVQGGQKLVDVRKRTEKALEESH